MSELKRVKINIGDLSANIQRDTGRLSVAMRRSSAQNYQELNESEAFIQKFNSLPNEEVTAIIKFLASDLITLKNPKKLTPKPYKENSEKNFQMMLLRKRDSTVEGSAEVIKNRKIFKENPTKILLEDLLTEAGVSFSCFSVSLLCRTDVVLDCTENLTGIASCKFIGPSAFLRIVKDAKNTIFRLAKEMRKSSAIRIEGKDSKLIFRRGDQPSSCKVLVFKRISDNFDIKDIDVQTASCDGLFPAIPYLGRLRAISDQEVDDKGELITQIASLVKAVTLGSKQPENSQPQGLIRALFPQFINNLKVLLGTRASIPQIEEEDSIFQEMERETKLAPEPTHSEEKEVKMVTTTTTTTSTQRVNFESPEIKNQIEIRDFQGFLDYFSPKIPNFDAGVPEEEVIRYATVKQGKGSKRFLVKKGEAWVDSKPGLATHVTYPALQGSKEVTLLIDVKSLTFDSEESEELFPSTP